MPDFPQNNVDLEKYQEKVEKRINKKYATLTKNVYFYLCFVCLELMDFHNCAKFGEKLLDTYGKELTVNTKF